MKICKKNTKKDYGATVRAVLSVDSAVYESEKAVLFQVAGWKFWVPLSCCELSDDGENVTIIGGEQMPVTMFVDSKNESSGKFERTKELQKTLKDLSDFLAKSNNPDCPF